MTLREPQHGDNLAHRFLVSVKGLVFRNDRVVLLRNERDEWELPGGKLEPDEEPAVCVVREIEEELGLDVRVERIVDSWVYVISPGVRVLIVTYGCTENAIRPATLSHEHEEVGWFELDRIDSLRMPDGYKKSIRSWSELCPRH